MRTMVPVALVALTKAGGQSLMKAVIFGKKTIAWVTVVLADEMEVLQCTNAANAPGCWSNAS